MNILALSRQHQRIQWLIDQARQLDHSQLELQAHWARYICVLASGFLENAIYHLYAAYARKCSNDAVANFVDTTLVKIQNPKASRFVEISRSFRPDWSDELQNYVDQDGRKDAIDAIMANRHLIAHGKDSGVTLARVAEYLRKSVDVIEFIEKQCEINVPISTY